LLAERRVLAHVGPEKWAIVLADDAAAVGPEARVEALSAEGHRGGKVVHALVAESRCWAVNNVYYEVSHKRCFSCILCGYDFSHTTSLHKKCMVISQEDKRVHSCVGTISLPRMLRIILKCT